MAGWLKNYFADSALATQQKMLAEKRKDIAWAERERRGEMRKNEEQIDEHTLQIAKYKKAIKRAENDRETIQQAWKNHLDRLKAEEAAIEAQIAQLEMADVITPLNKTLEIRNGS